MLSGDRTVSQYCNHFRKCVTIAGRFAERRHGWGAVAMPVGCQGLPDRRGHWFQCITGADDA